MSILNLWGDKKDLKILFSGILFGGFGISVSAGIFIGLHKAIQMGQYGLIHGAVVVFLKTVVDVVLIGCVISFALCLAIVLYSITCHLIQTSADLCQIINKKSKHVGNIILAIIIAISIAGAVIGISKLLRNHNNIDFDIPIQSNTTTYICGNISCPRDKLG